jgi:hypothetical protein
MGGLADQFVVLPLPDDRWAVALVIATHDDLEQAATQAAVVRLLIEEGFTIDPDGLRVREDREAQARTESP